MKATLLFLFGVGVFFISLSFSDNSQRDISESVNIDKVIDEVCQNLGHEEDVIKDEIDFAIECFDEVMASLKKENGIREDLNIKMDVAKNILLKRKDIIRGGVSGAGFVQGGKEWTEKKYLEALFFAKQSIRLFDDMEGKTIDKWEDVYWLLWSAKIADLIISHVPEEQMASYVHVNSFLSINRDVLERISRFVDGNNLPKQSMPIILINVLNIDYQSYLEKEYKRTKEIFVLLREQYPADQEGGALGQVKTILSILDQEEITQEQIENIKKQKESIRMNHPDKLPGIFLQMLDTIILSLESMEFQKIVVEGCPPEKVHNGKKSEEMKQ